MFLLVLRLLAVYFATAAVCLWLANRFVSPVRLRIAILLALGPFLLVGKALVTAGVHAPIDIAYLSQPLNAHGPANGTANVQSGILSDVVFQEVPWRKVVRDAAKNGRLPLWNPFFLAGEPLLAVQQPVVLHPHTWIGFLLPLAQAWTFEMASRYFLALLCAYLFLRELKCGSGPALLGAVGWAFCDYLVFFLGYPLTPAAAPFPLLLLGLRRLAREPGRRAGALTVVALLLILTSGHPESLLHCVAAAGIYFLFALSGVDRARRRRAVLIALPAGALTLGLGAVLLLPLAEALPHTIENTMRHAHFAKIRKSVPIEQAARHFLPNLQPYAFGWIGRGRTPEGFHEPGTYAGAVLWPFALAGLFTRGREKWALLVIGLLGAAMGARVPVITDVISKLPLFDIGLNQRLVFLAAFSTTALAALGAQRLIERGNRAFFVASSLAGMGVLWLLWTTGQERFIQVGLPPGYLQSRFLEQLLPLAAVALVILLLPRRRLAIGAGAAVLALVVQRGMEQSDVYPTYPSSAFYPGLAAFERIPRDLPFRMTALHTTFIPNIAALYELEDVRGYEAMTFQPLWETLTLWGVHQPVSFNRVDDPTRPFLSFLNVRWVLAPDWTYEEPPGWPVLYRGDEGTLVENPHVLPRAFVPRELGAEPDPARRVLALGAISDFRERGLLHGEKGAGGPMRWERNGAARVRITKYLPQRMDLLVEADAPAVVGTSVTSWPGWKLTIDGRKAPLEGFNHAFLAFRVTPGRHQAVLRYLPDGFVAGAAISALSLAIALALLFFPRLRISPPRRRG